MRLPALLTVLAIALAAAPSRADEPSPGPSHPAPTPPPWPTQQAMELSRQGNEHASQGDVGTALVRYLEAIKLDPTFSPAYIGLAAQYEARGDPAEAERIYAMALDHVPGFVDALVARARLRARLRRRDEAIADLEAAVSVSPDRLDVLQALVTTYVAERALPAALAASRRIAAVAEAQQDAAGVAEAKVRVKALALLVGEADPVTAGRIGRGAVRNALAGGSKRR